jgi:hypothetical protein
MGSWFLPFFGYKINDKYIARITSVTKNTTDKIGDNVL